MGRGSDTRERLIAVTIDLLWSDGYAVSVDSICERAGVGKGSFYHFFSSKDELVMAALDAHWATRQPMLDRLFSPTVPPLERFKGYFETMYERQRQLAARFGYPPGCFFCKLGFEVSSGTPIGKRVQEILNMYAKYYETALRDAAATGVDVGDIPQKARSLFAFMEGVLSQARIQNDLGMVRNLGKSAFAFLGLKWRRAA